MMYFLMLMLVASDGQRVEIRVEFKNHEACVAAADEIADKTKSYAKWFGAKVTSNGCYST